MAAIEWVSPPGLAHVSGLVPAGRNVRAMQGVLHEPAESAWNLGTARSRRPDRSLPEDRAVPSMGRPRLPATRYLEAVPAETADPYVLRT